MNSRSLKRQAAKNAYKQFKNSFRTVKRLQAKMSGAEKRRAEMDGEQMLNMCPPFSVWWDAVKRPAQFKATPEEVQDHIEDLEWDE